MSQIRDINIETFLRNYALSSNQILSRVNAILFTDGKIETLYDDIIVKSSPQDFIDLLLAEYSGLINHQYNISNIDHLNEDGITIIINANKGGWLSKLSQIYIKLQCFGLNDDDMLEISDNLWRLGKSQEEQNHYTCNQGVCAGTHSYPPSKYRWFLIQ